MRATDFATAVDGLAKGFGDAIKARDKQELESLIRFFQKFRDQPLSTVIKFGEEMLRKERGSLLALIQRIRTLKSENPSCDDSAEDIWEDIQKLKSKELGDLLKSFEKPTHGKMADKLDRVQKDLLFCVSKNGTQETAEANESVENLVSEYQTIEKQIDQYTYDEIRELLGRFRTEPREVVQDAISRIGFSHTGNSSQLIDKLISELTFIKRIQDQASMM